jgi:hypothetical protein
MADNRTTDSSGRLVSTGFALRELTYSGDANQLVAPSILTIPAGAEGSMTASDVTASNPLPVAELGFATATLSNVSASATSVTGLSANSARKGWEVENDSDEELLVKRGTTASSTSFSIRVPPRGAYRELGPRVYTGRLDFIWGAASGAGRVTEHSA